MSLSSTTPWQTPLVYGLGVSGRAAVELLRARGVPVLTYDDHAPSEAPFAADDGVAALAPGDLPEAVDVIVVSPGVPQDRPLLRRARERGVEVIAEIELASRLLEGPVLAITGSNGKSTTTALLGHLLQAAGHRAEVCGNIGEPLSSKVDGAPGRVFVVELSSFQLESTISLRPRVAALLNLSPDHLDRYESLEHYGQAKQRIFRNQGAGDVAVVNADDAAVMDLSPVAPVRTRAFSRRRPVEDGCYLDGRTVLEVVPGHPPEILFDLDQLALEGEHNIENAMAASLSARSFGAPTRELSAALPSFGGLPHRLQRVGERSGVRYYDDSKGTNVAATASSLAGFDDGSVHLILGGRNKDADLGELRPIVEAKAAETYLIGETADELEGLLREVAVCHNVGTLEAAVQLAADRAKPGQAVVLSPACASFDQFRSFVDRGETFQRLVATTIGGET